MAQTVNRNLNLAITGDSKGFVAANDKAVNSGKRFEKQVKRINGANKKFGDGFKRAANSASVLNGPLNGVSGRLSALGTGFGTLGPLTLGAGVAITAFATALASSVSKASQLQVEMGRLDALIKSTGGAAGFTAQEIDEQSRAIGRNTLSNASEMRKAAGILLTFRTIQGETFKETLKLTQDMAAVMGTSASAAAVQFGKALEDPTTGLTALKRSGVSFSEAEKEVIKDLQQSGQLFEAQTLVISKLQTQIGGAGAGENVGLVGSTDELSENWTELLEKLGQTTGASEAVTSFFSMMSNGVSNLNAKLSETDVEKFERLRKEIMQAAVISGSAPNDDASKYRLKQLQEEYKATGRAINKRVEFETSAKKASLESQKQLEEEASAARQQKLDEGIATELEKQNGKNLKLQEMALLAEDKKIEAEAFRYERIQEQTVIELNAFREKFGMQESIEAEYRERQANEEALHQAKITKIKDAETKKQQKVEAQYSKTIGGMRNQVANQAIDALSSMTEEGSKAHKVLFLASKALAVGQILVNTQVAAVRALAELGPVAGPPAAATITSLGYASAGIVAATALAGVAHGGLENVPKEATYLLDKNERVLSPNQNKDLTSFLNNKEERDGGSVNVVFEITTNDAGSFANSIVENQDVIEGIIVNAFDRVGVSGGLN